VASLPSWVVGEEHKPAPQPLLLVQAFANTIDLEDGTDRLADPETARPWLTQAGLAGRAAPLGADQLELARDVRDGLRAMLAANAGEASPSAADLAAIRELAGGRRPAIDVAASGRIEIGADGRDLADGLISLLVIVRDAQRDGTWSRLRLCANSDCRWAFYDGSRNRRGTWCRMETCGNRIKNRRLRARRADG
jgi:predicted RNA-binding Zn ribbon-like protein